MNDDPIQPNIPTEDGLPPSWLETLRALPSEQGGPSLETDAAVIASARETLAAIRRRRIHIRLWPILAAAACLIFALTLLYRSRANPSSLGTATAEDKYALILREVSAVFPQQIKAIISNGSDLQISLADQPFPNGGQAVVVEVCGKNKCTTIITYVGQTVEIDQHSVTVRMNEKGGIVIDSPDFQVTGSASGFHIKTRRI